MIISIAMMILVGCSKNSQPVVKQEGSSSSVGNVLFTYKNQTQRYQTKVPADFADHKGNDETMYFGYGEKSITGDVLIGFFSKSSACSPLLTGASRTTVATDVGTKATWGRVDAWDGAGGEGWEPPHDLQKVVCTHATPYIYAFCSENNGKTVVICINEMKDNPDLAKQIFETFRWTK